MAICFIRAGSHCEYEQKFSQGNRATLAPARKQAIMRRYL